jgi:putative ABC transport system substrate-binding protein
VRRREFLTLLGAAAAWPAVARAQQRPMPVIGILGAAPASIDPRRMVDFRRGLRETGYVEGTNVVFEFLRAEGQYERISLMAHDLVQRRVNVIVTPNSTAASLAAKAATTEIPIVFSITTDPVKIGLVASLARPGGNVTGVYFFNTELGAKRLEFLRELLPNAKTIAVMVNPRNSITGLGVKDIRTAAESARLDIRVVNASDSDEIDSAFAALSRDRPDALMVLNEPLFASRRTQIALLAARHTLPAIYSNREYVDAGGLMSYSANFAEVYRQLGIYTGRLLKGEKPMDLPVVQSTKFEFIINLQSAKALGLTVPPTLLARADEVIE